MTQGEARPLHLHTLESLCADLIAGRSTACNDETLFALPSAGARSLLHWYYRRRGQWAANMNDQHGDEIADAVSEMPPDLEVAVAAESPTKRRYTLQSIRAHRFAGVQGYGTANKAPELFTFQPSHALSLFEGLNGHGKSSLLNVMVWCLTGSLLRAQRAPEDATVEFPCRIGRERPTEEDADASEHLLTPVTPLPDPRIYAPGADEPVPVDTWVELTLRDDEGRTYVVKRIQRRKPNKKIEERAEGFEALGLDLTAYRIATVMPAMIQHIKFGSSSDLGAAVSALTGFADLSLLKSHAGRARNHLLAKMTKKRKEEISSADRRFGEARDDLIQRIAEFEDMSPSETLPTPSSSGDVETSLAGLRGHFEKCRSQALDRARTILGASFDPDDAQAQDDLVATIAPARLEIDRLDKLPSAVRLAALGALTAEERTVAESLLGRIRDEAVQLTHLLDNPALARREQVYARLAEWMKANGVDDVSICHGCERPADEVVDSVSGRAFSQHLKEALEGDSELISHSLESWCSDRLNLLAGDLPAALVAERQRDLPAHPGGLLRRAVVDELFETQSFAGTLSSLKEAHEAHVDGMLDALPDFDEPKARPFDAAILANTEALALVVARVERALGFGAWHVAAGLDVEKVMSGVVGDDTAITTEAVPDAPDTLGPRLAALEAMIDGSEPIRDALKFVERMEEALAERREGEKRISAYTDAAEELIHLQSLGDLAAAQVNALQTRLRDRADHWKRQIYQDSITSHQLQRTSSTPEGVLELHVGSEVIDAPAHHVANASALRAALVGFFLAFREHVLEARGGLDVLVLDDPQELLDKHNRDKMGLTLVALAGAGAQLFVTTYDGAFAHKLVDCGRKDRLVGHFSIHPVNAKRDLIELSPAKQEVEQAAIAFGQKEDDHIAARHYANQSRIYIETRLRDLFDDPTYPAYASSNSRPGFNDHLAYLRGLVSNAPNDLFRSARVKSFAEDPRLQSPHECYQLLNDAHHDPEKISYGRVEAVASDLKALRKGADDLHTDFRDFRWRNQMPEVQAQIAANDNVALDGLVPPAFDHAIYPGLAASTGVSGVGNQVEPEDRLAGQWFSDKALFHIRASTLGFSLPSGAIAIVEALPSEGHDRNLVIARKGDLVLARRLLRAHDADHWALAAETPDPRRSPPSIVAGKGDMTLHRIVGCLLLDPPFVRAKGEAVQVDAAPLLAKIEQAWRVDQDSAIPFALPGQILLGGSKIVDYGGHEGKLAALWLADGSQLLKRIGSAMPGQHGYLRHFETIGGLGGSVLLQTEDVEESPLDLPVIKEARFAIGVIYDL